MLQAMHKDLQAIAWVLRCEWLMSVKPVILRLYGGQAESSQKIFFVQVTNSFPEKLVCHFENGCKALDFEISEKCHTKTSSKATFEASLINLNRKKSLRLQTPQTPPRNAFACKLFFKKFSRQAKAFFYPKRYYLMLAE